MLRLYQQKYAIEDPGHVLYSLVYFDDADKERMPRMLWTLTGEPSRMPCRNG